MKNEGYIYLIKSDFNGEISYKIGKTKRKVSERLCEIQTGNPGKLTVLYEFKSKNVNQLESTLHNLYKLYNIKNEWFNDKLDTSKFIDICNIFEKSQQILKKYVI